MRLPEAVDLQRGLTTYIQSNYSPDELKSVSKAIHDVHQMRNKIAQSIVRNEADHGQSIEYFLQYYYTLLSLGARFPFGNQSQSSILGFKSGKVPSVRVVFTWYDSFRHSNKVSDYDLNFEKASVLFDIAALYSRQATQVKAQATAKDDGPIKEACRLFQCSSGVFEYLSKSVELGAASGLSLDLSAEGLGLLAKLMLAQAMACFFEKATFAASPKLVAKLAMGVSELFKQTYALCEKPRIKVISGRNDVYAWETHCYYQMLCYQAASHYWLAKGLMAEDSYGEEIAHLEKAKTLLEGASRIEVSLLKNLTENRQRLETAIKTRLTQAQKDNDTIYYAAIPKQDTIRDPEAVISVKSLPFEIKMEQKDDAFGVLVSPGMKLQASEFKVKLNELIATTQKTVQEASDYTKMHLSSLNLPAALEALEPSVGLPDDVWNQVAEVQSKGKRGTSKHKRKHGRAREFNETTQVELKARKGIWSYEEPFSLLGILHPVVSTSSLTLFFFFLFFSLVGLMHLFLIFLSLTHPDITLNFRLLFVFHFFPLLFLILVSLSLSLSLSLSPPCSCVPIPFPPVFLLFLQAVKLLSRILIVILPSMRMMPIQLMRIY